VDLRAADASGKELKETLKVTVDSEYAVRQKLAYKTQTRKDIEVIIMVALQSLRNDQVTIAGLEVEVNNLKNAANYVMDMVETLGRNPKPAIDRLLLQTRS
jgi:hypothetical protein